MRESIKRDGKSTLGNWVAEMVVSLGKECSQARGKGKDVLPSDRNEN